MSTFLTADTHFGHDGIIRHCNRGFSSVREMDEAMIAAWNEVVTRESDEVYHLGDFGFSRAAGDDREPLEVIFHRLRGRKHLIIGNHDDRNPRVLKLPWETQSYLRWYRADGRRAHLCHYPLETWRDAHRGSLMLHGHSHGSLKRIIPHRIDVGWDVWRQPMEFEELWARAARQEFAPQDHHA